MIKVGITGQSGFVGTHLYNELGLFCNIERIPFKDIFFQEDTALREFVKQCDVIVHLAAVNRHPSPDVIYETNVNLVKALIVAMELECVTPFILFSSSTQEDKENEYGRSKRVGRKLLEDWANRNNASFTGLVVPNVFGPFGRPNYNSFVATFCYRLTHGEQSDVLQDDSVQLIYVSSLCRFIIDKVRENADLVETLVERVIVPFDVEKRVSEVLSLLKEYKSLYFDQGFIPELKNKNEINFFNTFRSYIDNKNYYPIKLAQHVDPRGMFVETIKLKVGGQVSFSTTVPGITRGNHYHTRKMERFVVIKGNAKVQLRKVGTDEVIDFYLNGIEPSYVDMPIWYTHNITNIGENELYTQFWINEWYDPEDGDTYFETV